MRYLEQLIDRARELSQNTRYDANSGISQKTFVQFFQNAQDFVMREVVNSKSKYFLHPLIVPIVGGQQDYDYPDDIILQGIDTIEWSDDLQTWLTLEKNITKDRTVTIVGYPYGYYLTRTNYILTPPIQYGWLRVTYNRRPKRLEFRAAQVSSTTGAPITSITTNGSFANQDMDYINQFSSITVVGKDGAIKVADMPITSASGTTIVVPSYTLASGESIVSGDYILAGGNSTNVPNFDDMVESFLILHATYQAKYGDSSQWSKATKDDVMNHFKQIIAAFSTLSEDVNHIGIINTDYLALW